MTTPSKIPLDPGYAYYASLKESAWLGFRGKGHGDDDDDILWILVLELKSFLLYPSVVYVAQDGTINENTLLYMNSFHWKKVE